MSETCKYKLYVLDAFGYRVEYRCNRKPNHSGWCHGVRDTKKGQGKLPYTIKFSGEPYYYEDNVAEKTQEA